MKSKKINSWERTRKDYVNWLTNSELRLEFSKYLNYENLSLWWINNLMEKDNINDPDWYKNLHQRIGKKNFELIKNEINFFILLFRIIKKFFFKIIILFFIKFFFKEKNKIKKKNCFYTWSSNFIIYNNYFIDRQYGLYGLKEKKKIHYLIDISENFNLFYKYFNLKQKISKTYFEYSLINRYINFLDIVKIYYFTFKKFFLLVNILKKKNYFIINKINCEDILKPKLIESFFGPIQNQILKGIALRKCLFKLKCRNFVGYLDFHPQARALYYFAKNSCVKNVIDINHANYSENNIFFNFNKLDFAENNEQNSFYSPKPDVYFCQGKKYFYKLKKTFKAKIYTIGSFKTELNMTKYLSINKFNNKKKKSLKKIVILCSSNDYRSFIDLLNECNLDKFKVIVAPHPYKINETINEFRNNFKKKFIFYKSSDKTKLFKDCDYVVFGDTSLGLELSIKGYNVFRLYDEKYLPTFDLNNEIATAKDVKTLKKFLQIKSIKQKKSLLVKNYFYKYDNKTSERFKKILDKM